MDHLNQRIFEYVSQLGWTGEAIVRLILSAVLGGLVGVEREVRGRQAGFRTNMLVAVGSTLVMLVSTSFAYERWPLPATFNINIDPGRIAYGVMTGVGFMGAGAIVKQGLTVRGLTTAAALWCVAAIGLSIGMHLYVLSVCATLVVLVALWVLDFMEELLPRRRFRHLVLRCRWTPGCVHAMIGRFGEMGFTVMQHSFRRIDDLTYADIELFVVYTDPRQYHQLENRLHGDCDCELIESRSD